MSRPAEGAGRGIESVHKFRRLLVPAQFRSPTKRTRTSSGLPPTRRPVPGLPSRSNDHGDTAVSSVASNLRCETCETQFGREGKRTEHRHAPPANPHRQAAGHRPRGFQGWPKEMPCDRATWSWRILLSRKQAYPRLGPLQRRVVPRRRTAAGDHHLPPHLAEVVILVERAPVPPSREQPDRTSLPQVILSSPQAELND